MYSHTTHTYIKSNHTYLNLRLEEITHAELLQLVAARHQQEDSPDMTLVDTQGRLRIPDKHTLKIEKTYHDVVEARKHVENIYLLKSHSSLRC